MSDDALLDEELHWRSRPGHRRRPAGANAITAIGIVITVVLWGITWVLLKPFLAGSPGSGVIDPKSIVVLIVFGVAMFVAAGLAGRLWVAIGPGARSVLRPIGVLGPWPMLGIAFFTVLFVVSMFAAPFLPKKPPAATSGRNWRFAKTVRLGVTYEEAVARCKATGERVPSRDDLARFDPPFPRQTTVWLEKPAGADLPIALTSDGQVAHMTAAPGRSPHAYVVCFRP
jgi:hypothetical protein